MWNLPKCFLYFGQSVWHIGVIYAGRPSCACSMLGLLITRDDTHFRLGVSRDRPIHSTKLKTNHAALPHNPRTGTNFASSAECRIKLFKCLAVSLTPCCRRSLGYLGKLNEKKKKSKIIEPHLSEEGKKNTRYAFPIPQSKRKEERKTDLTGTNRWNSRRLEEIKIWQSADLARKGWIGD